MVMPRSCSSARVSVKRLGSYQPSSNLFVFLRHSRFTSLCGRNDTSTLDKRIGKSRFSVVDVSNDTLYLKLVCMK